MKRALKSIIPLLMAGIISMTAAGCFNGPAVYMPEENEWKEQNMYTNHISLPVKPQDGAADPFITRYNGWYYLYTTGVVNIWRSKDLAEWTYAGTANNEKPLNVAFAPEVYYWNGKFYMYTSPSGNGHYILSSDSPIGPFEYVTDNIGLTIDGSIFIDDDGSWYFTHASSLGILAHKMKSPTEIDPQEKNLKSTYMGHWTEGSMIIKRDGRYFITYTGNHYQSKGYRVNYSVSGEGLLGPYVRPSNNPILINDIDFQHALGHSSFVYGPDLDSMFIAYHSYTVKSQPRVLNIDRLSFNGSRMYVNGPTWFATPVADLPRFALWPEDDPVSAMEKVLDEETEMLLSKEVTNESFTAEWNLSGGDGDTGVVFCKDEDGSYIQLLWLEDRSKVTVEKHKAGGTETLGTFDLPQGFDRNALHTIKVQYSPLQLDVYFDGMHKLTYLNPGLGAGRIGYVYTGAQPAIGFTGFSDVCRGSGDYQAFKPVPGGFDAVHHLQQKDIGFGGSLGIGTMPDDVSTLKFEKKGAWASYAINTEKDGTYGIALYLKDNITSKAQVEILEDGKRLGIFSIEGRDNPDSEAKGEETAEDTEQEFITLPLGRVRLKSGLHRLAVRLVEGSGLEVLSIQLYEAADTDLPVAYKLTQRHKDMNMIGSGSFDFTQDGMKAVDRADMKMVIGSKSWSDYIVDVSVTPGTIGMGRSGLIVRSTNESYHPHQNNNAMQGYFVGMESDGIFLRRMNYDDSDVIQKIPFKPEKGVTYTMRVEAVGSTIKVYVDDMENPVITYSDPMPFLYGRVGIWSFKDETVFRDLKIRTDLNSPI